MPKQVDTKTSPVTCNICSRTIGDKFYDARVRGGGWADLCPACFRQIGNGLGTGNGQEYTKQPDGTFQKTAG